MIEYITSFDMLYLSSQLPEKLEIRTNLPSVNVGISIGYVYAYESTMYPYNGVVTVNDLRSIVETAMWSANICQQIMTIEAWADGENSSMLDDIVVVYATHQVKTSSENFLRNNFLMSAKSVLAPKDQQIDLYYFNDGSFQEQKTAYITYTMMNNPDDIRTYTWIIGTTNHTHAESFMRHITMDYNTFANRMLASMNTMCRVISVVYKIGNKLFSIFFTEDEQPMVFQFVNAFGCQEMAFVYGKETVKTEVEHSEAVLGRRTVYYDDKVKVIHEVETAPMTYNQAVAMNQLLTSPDVKIKLDSTRLPAVLLSDLGSEISSSDRDEITLKFSWRYADGTEWL